MLLSRKHSSTGQAIAGTQNPASALLPGSANTLTNTSQCAIRCDNPAEERRVRPASRKSNLETLNLVLSNAFVPPQVMLKKEYQDQRRTKNPRLVGGRAWYNLQAFRAVNQAVGRQGRAPTTGSLFRLPRSRSPFIWRRNIASVCYDCTSGVHAHVHTRFSMHNVAIYTWLVILARLICLPSIFS